MKRLNLIIAMLGVFLYTISSVNAQHFTPVYSGNAYQAMNFVVSAAALDAGNLGAGDEIAVFDVDGGTQICVGSLVLTGPISGNVVFVAATDDPLTPAKDGFTVGNSIIYRYWDNSAGVEIVCVTPTYIPGYDEVFASLGTAVLSLNGITSPTADAGADDDVCETDSYTLSGSATNQSSVLWTTAGTGTFDDASLLAATYTPSGADITAGSVVLTLTAYAIAPCGDDATDDMTLTIQDSPTANAGADDDVCEGDTYTLAGSASNYASVLWTTGGTGTFDDASLLTATYTPSSADITAGSVVLTLTATASAPCTGNASDDMTLSIYDQPTANAGADDDVCAGDSYTLSGSATHQGSVLWTTGGTGTFDDASLLAATYTPSAADITAGSVVLTLTAIAVSPCGTNASDDMTLSIQAGPTAGAGADDDICEGDSYLLSGSATNQASVLWTTGGTGTFDDASLLAATYTPSSADITAGSVVLTLTATATAPCAGNASDDMTLSIQAGPIANAGPDDVVDSGSTYTLSGAASGQSSVTWTTAGDGTFDDASLLAATYTPGTSDLDFGSVVLTLTANATAPCSTPDADDMTLFFSYTQSINLTQGWNIMSFYVQPVNMDMQIIVQPLITNSTLIKVQDENGDYVQFIPGPGWSNTIGNMANTEGYYIKVTANTNLDSDGTYVIFPYDVALNTGWNMAGYPVKQSQDAMTLLADLITNNTLIKVMDEAGNFIQNIPPYGWLNTIVNFDPDEGYYIKTTANDILTYDQPTKASTPGIAPEIPATQHFFSSGSNPFNPMNIVVQDIICDGFVIEDGDEIAVYDGGLEVGSAVIHQEYNGLQVIIAAGDDPATEEIDGFTAGNSITFRYWDKSHNMVYENIQSTHYYGNEDFAGLGTYAGDLKISALGVSEHSQSDLAFLGQNYPNPFSENTTITYGIYQDGDVLLSIFDVSGRRIQTLEDTYRPRGRYTVSFNNTSLEPGIYYYQLEYRGSGSVFSETKKMIIH